MNEIVSAIQVVPIQHYLIVSLLLFSIGMVGVLFRRNAIVILMSIELMLNSINLLLVAFSAYFSNSGGQIFVFFIMVVAAAEVAVGLSLLVRMKRNLDTTDISFLRRLKD
jgi:NADH-quinone oxidoreductase subunit K